MQDAYPTRATPRENGCQRKDAFLTFPKGHMSSTLHILLWTSWKEIDYWAGQAEVGRGS